MGMTNREKVIKGLECCMSCQMDGFGCNRVPCPYNELEDCEGALHYDALALLKVQEPRVLNLNEIHRGLVVWLEQYKVPEILQVIGGSSAIDICGDGQKCFITGDYNSITPYDEDYNKFWRAWTHKPTKEQRKAVKWDD